MNNSNNVDEDYFKRKLQQILRDLPMYTNPELARELTRLGKTAHEISAVEVIVKETE